MKVGKIYVLFAGGEVRGQSFSLYGPVNNLIIFFSNDSQTKKITEKTHASVSVTVRDRKIRTVLRTNQII